MTNPTNGVSLALDDLRAAGKKATDIAGTIRPPWEMDSVNRQMNPSNFAESAAMVDVNSKVYQGLANYTNLLAESLNHNGAMMNDYANTAAQLAQDHATSIDQLDAVLRGKNFDPDTINQNAVRSPRLPLPNQPQDATPLRAANGDPVASNTLPPYWQPPTDYNNTNPRPSSSLRPTH